MIERPLNGHGREGLSNASTLEGTRAEAVWTTLRLRTTLRMMLPPLLISIGLTFTDANFRPSSPAESWVKEEVVEENLSRRIFLHI